MKQRKPWNSHIPSLIFCLFVTEILFSFTGVIDGFKKPTTSRNVISDLEAILFKSIFVKSYKYIKGKKKNQYDPVVESTGV